MPGKVGCSDHPCKPHEQPSPIPKGKAQKKRRRPANTVGYEVSKKPCSGTERETESMMYVQEEQPAILVKKHNLHAKSECEAFKDTVIRTGT